MSKLTTTPSQGAPMRTPVHGVRQFLAELGPGLITGAADEVADTDRGDPAIAAYLREDVAQDVPVLCVRCL